MTRVAILDKKASGYKGIFDAVHVRTEILDTPELERDWENIYRRFASPTSEDMKLIQTKADGQGVVKIYSVSDRVLDAMYTLGEEDHKVTKSALNWAIDKVADGKGEYPWDKNDKTAIVWWVQAIANAMVTKINPNFVGYVSHRDEDELVDRIANVITFCDLYKGKRPSCQQILKYWIEGDWAPIYMYTED